MLTATAAELAERRVAIGRTPVLGRLQDRLARQLKPLLDRPLYLPEQKALLSRDGGVCADDGSRLRFDPLVSDRHQCPRCGKWYEGERHHRAWITRYQIWLSERAIHLALLGGLRQDPALARRGCEILTGYAGRYRDYPNRDNVLGPTRLFFSTYLESIWLCQVVIAASLLDVQGFAWPPGGREAVRRMAGESAGLIRSFDEGWSNRQAWNNAALAAAGHFLDARDVVSHALDAEHGIRAMLAYCVSADGLWFEGENYHFFATRGLLLAAEFGRRNGVDLYREPATRAPLAALFVGPLKTVLPDLTLPARSDSPYGVSLFQPRFADLWEVARARAPDPSLDHLLAELYGPRHPEGPDDGIAEMAEQEQNRPPQRLSRDQLGWKALLWMPEADPVGDPGEWQPGSVLLADHGVAVLRQGNRYLSIECGGRPGGHGHPDLLHTTLHWSSPWLMDPGTASYVSPSLHWYRSTLAHNAPAVTGADQVARDAWCSCFAQEGSWSWVRAEARDLFGPRTLAIRTLVAGPDWVLDVLDVEAPARLTVDLPIHPLGAMVLPAEVERRNAAPLPQVTRIAELAGPIGRLAARTPLRELSMAVAPRRGEQILAAMAPGPPDLTFADGRPMEFLIRRAAGAGRWIQAYAMIPIGIEESGREIRVMRDRAQDVVRISDKEATIRTASGETIRLSGRRQLPRPAPASRPAPIPVIPGRDIRLDGRHYRRSEEPYDPAFAADLTIAGGAALSLDLRVSKPELVIRSPAEPDPRLDNESADIHSDGALFYIHHAGWQGFVLVPDPDSERVYIRAVAGTAADTRRLKATWHKTDGGYRMALQFDTGRPVRRGDQFAINLAVNEMRSGHERRTGQLALSGGGWVYLRGDRESPHSAVVVEIA